MARRKKSQTQQQVEEVSTDAEVTVEVVEEKASEPEVVEEPAPVVEAKVEAPKPKPKTASLKKEVEIVKGRKYSVSGAECVFVEAKGDKLVVRMTSDNTYRKVLKSDLS